MTQEKARQVREECTFTEILKNSWKYTEYMN